MQSESMLPEQIAASVNKLSGRTLVAIDGVDGAGKTTFADRLAPFIEAAGRQTIRASIDGFHNPRAVRYKRGKSDPLGFFYDSYNYNKFRQLLVDPFKNGAASVATACFDHHADRAIKRTINVCSAAVLLLDGIFLHRDELQNDWDFSIFPDVPFAVSYRHMAIRDHCNPDPSAPENHRYYQGQRIYLSICTPAQRASVVIANAIPDMRDAAGFV